MMTFKDLDIGEKFIFAEAINEEMPSSPFLKINETDAKDLCLNDTILGCVNPNRKIIWILTEPSK